MEERRAAVRQAAASDFPLHGWPHITTSAIENVETLGDGENKSMRTWLSPFSQDMSLCAKIALYLISRSEKVILE
jgi:hypothetical protein